MASNAELGQIVDCRIPFEIAQTAQVLGIGRGVDARWKRLAPKPHSVAPDGYGLIACACARNDKDADTKLRIFQAVCIVAHVQGRTIHMLCGECPRCRTIAAVPLRP